MIDLKELRRRVCGIESDQGSYGPTWLNPREAVALLDMLEAASLDAARYHWLSVQHWVEPEATFRLGLEDVEFINTYRLQLDVAIDAAMAATKG